MRQGNELQAGTKHSVFVHFNTKKGFITSDDILLIPEIIEKGNVTPSTKGRLEYKYINPSDNTTYKVVTEVKKGHEILMISIQIKRFVRLSRPVSVMRQTRT